MSCTHCGRICGHAPKCTRPRKNRPYSLWPARPQPETPPRGPAVWFENGFLQIDFTQPMFRIREQFAKLCPAAVK